MAYPQFNVDKMTEYVAEILKHCGYMTNHARKFVELSLSRKERFHCMNFDEFGRREIVFSVTPQILLHDYKWFRMLLEEMDITSECLTVMLGKVFVLTKRGGGAPLTKELAKKADQLFSNRKSWYNHYEYRDQVMNKPEVFLARLGDVVTLDKKAVISINPGDIIRKSVEGKYAGYSSCHNLAKGAYRQGCVNYALDKNHIITYITGSADPAQKIHGRSMMIISNDMNVVAMRRFYPSPEVFGESRALAIREQVHRLIDPAGVWTKSKNTELLRVTEANNGYLDGIAVATYKDPAIKMQEVQLCQDVFCFTCGAVHQRPSMFCGGSSCTNRGGGR